MFAGNERRPATGAVAGISTAPLDWIWTALQIGVVGLDGQIELEALRLYRLPEAASALLCGTPTLPVGKREFAAERRSTCRTWPQAPCTWSTSRSRAPGLGEHAAAILAELGFSPAEVAALRAEGACG